MLEPALPSEPPQPACRALGEFFFFHFLVLRVFGTGNTDQARTQRVCDTTGTWAHEHEAQLDGNEGRREGHGNTTQ